MVVTGFGGFRLSDLAFSLRSDPDYNIKYKSGITFLTNNTMAFPECLPLRVN